jgi:hypothetical protein
MATTAPAFSDDKIVVDPADDTHGDFKSHSSATVVNDQQDGKMVSSAEEKIDTTLTPGPSDEKVPAVDPSTTSPNTSTEKQAIASPNATDQKIPANTTTNTNATPSEKIPTIEPDTDSTVPQRAPTTTSSWGGSTSTRHPARVYREYAFHHTTAWKMNHNVVVDPNNAALYLVAVSGFAKGREDVVLHAISEELAAKGASLTAEEGKGCQGVAFAQFPHKRPDMVQLGLGSSGRMAEVKWFELKREAEGGDWWLGLGGEGGRRLRLATTTGSAGGDGESPSVESPGGEDARATVGSFKFVDSGLGVALASYTEQKVLTSWKKRGKLRIYDRALRDVEVLSEEDMEHLVVLCCAVLNEKRRRKTVRKWAGMGVI